jgi:Uma2 family endonuclease
MGTRTTLTLDEFLELPETEPSSEYLDGEVVQKMAPSWYHARLVTALIRLIGDYLEAHPREGLIATELRHATSAAGDRSYVPDISVLRRRNTPRGREARRQGPVWRPPDFAIEVLSPGDYPGRVFDRADFYMRVGTELLWFVDPELETVTVYRPGSSPTVHRPPELLDGNPVLVSLRLSLETLFAILHEDEDDDGVDSGGA